MYAPPYALRVTSVTRGTTASPKACKSFAPRRTTSSHPGRHLADNRVRPRSRPAAPRRCRTSEHEPGRLLRAERVQAASQSERVVRDDADRPPAKSPEGNGDIGSPPGVQFDRRARIQQAIDQWMNVVGALGDSGSSAARSTSATCLAVRPGWPAESPVPAPARWHATRRRRPRARHLIGARECRVRRAAACRHPHR